MSEPHNYRENIVGFEIGVYQWFTERKYKSAAYTDLYGAGKKYGNNPYENYPFELIYKCKSSVIRRKDFFWSSLGRENVENYLSQRLSKSF